MIPLNINKSYSHVILSHDDYHDSKYPVVLIESSTGKTKTQFANKKMGLFMASWYGKQALQVSVLPANYKDYIKAYKGMNANFMRSSACNQDCDHHYDNFKKSGVEICYMKALFDVKPKCTSAYKKQSSNFTINLPYEIRCSYIGEIAQCSRHQLDVLKELVFNSIENYCYTSDHARLPDELKTKFQVSATTLDHCRYALKNNFGLYLSCTDQQKKEWLPILKTEFPNSVWHMCQVSIHSNKSCFTCETKCNGNHNIIAILEKTKKRQQVQAKKNQKGIHDFVFMYDLLLCGLIAIRLKSLVIFYFYLMITYTPDIINLVMELLK